MLAERCHREAWKVRFVLCYAPTEKSIKSTGPNTESNQELRAFQAAVSKGTSLILRKRIKPDINTIRCLIRVRYRPGPRTDYKAKTHFVSAVWSNFGSAIFTSNCPDRRSCSFGHWERIQKKHRTSKPRRICPALVPMYVLTHFDSSRHVRSVPIAHHLHAQKRRSLLSA